MIGPGAVAAIAVWAFVLGASIGSFLNVVVYRLPRRMSLSTPPSACPSCGHPIRWRDNVPILSWLVLRGRCRDCRASISARYPAVEAALAGGHSGWPHALAICERTNQSTWGQAAWSNDVQQFVPVDFALPAFATEAELREAAQALAGDIASQFGVPAKYVTW